MEQAEQRPIHQKKNRWYFFKQPFEKFGLTFNEAPTYRKVSMILNFIFPGLGNIMIGVVELGLVTLAVFALLIFGTCYFGTEIGSGRINTSVLTNIVVFGCLAFGILALYYSSFSSNVINNYKLNGGNEIKKFVIAGFFVNLWEKISGWFAKIGFELRRSRPKEKTILITSFFVMGIPLMFYKEFLKGLLYFFIQFVFIFYMIARGAADISNFFVLNAKNASPLVYGCITIAIILFFVLMYFMNLNNVIKSVSNVNESRKNEDIRDELHDVINSKFYVTSLIIPVLGALVFTVIPLCFMILVAFTNYSLVTAEGYDNFNVSKDIFLNWVGLETFKRVFYEGANLQDLLSVFSWTMIWAAFATFSCYFGGLFLAMLLNKKSVKPKILFRSLFVVAMAMPQFVSLLIMRTLFSNFGAVNNLLLQWGWIDEYIPFWQTEYLAKILILVINMWVGIPYYMLLMSGLLINIPNDYYEAANIEGASKWQQFKRITFPNILYMTTPMLITSFVSNINNFNVIYFLTEGGTITGGVGSTAAKTDILITWLYKLTMVKYDYNFGAAIGIVMFIISATLSLIVFRRSKAYNNEEAFR